MTQRVLIIRQPSALRSITEAEGLQALPPDQRGVPTRVVEVPTAQFATAVTQGDWGGHDSFLREKAAEVRARAKELGDVVIHYLGLAEVPHIIGLAAHVGNEWAVMPHDHHGDAGPWQWPDIAQTSETKTLGTDELAVTVKARGSAVMRVSITATVTDEDVRAVVGENLLADVTVTVADQAPAPKIVRSLEDVAAVRRAFVTAYNQVLNARPGIDVVHGTTSRYRLTVTEAGRVRATGSRRRSCSRRRPSRRRSSRSRPRRSPRPTTSVKRCGAVHSTTSKTT
jgi:hypothetical protein